MKRRAKSAILQMNCARDCGPRWKKTMPQAESPKQYIERLSALPPRKRLEAWHAIPDQTIRQQVAVGMSAEVHSEMLAEILLENLKRNAQASVDRRKPNLAA